MRRLRLVVNRATGIGEIGLNCTPALMKALGVGHQPIYAPLEELDIKQFRFLGDSE